SGEKIMGCEKPAGAFRHRGEMVSRGVEAPRSRAQDVVRNHQVHGQGVGMRLRERRVHELNGPDGHGKYGQPARLASWNRSAKPRDEPAGIAGAARPGTHIEDDGQDAQDEELGVDAQQDKALKRAEEARISESEGEGRGELPVPVEAGSSQEDGANEMRGKSESA